MSDCRILKKTFRFILLIPVKQRLYPSVRVENLITQKNYLNGVTSLEPGCLKVNEFEYEKEDARKETMREMKEPEGDACSGSSRSRTARPQRAPTGQRSSGAECPCTCPSFEGGSSHSNLSSPKK